MENPPFVDEFGKRWFSIAMLVYRRLVILPREELSSSWSGMNGAEQVS